jgi:hypothetical protein
MRKLVLLGFLSIPFFTQAQFVKGDKVLGGTLSFYSQNAPDQQGGGLSYKARRFSLTPSMSFLLNKNFAIGGLLGYNSSLQEIPSSSPSGLELISKSFSAGIFGQQYFNISDKFLFTLIGQFKFERGFDKDYYFDPQFGEVIERKSQIYNLSTTVRPTFIFFPSPKWGFEASIGSVSYTFTRNLSTDDKVNRFSINYGAITFGVAYYFLKTSRED